MSNPQETKGWSQKDFEIATATLRHEATKLESVLRASGREVPARPPKTGHTLDNFDAMEAHMAKLHALVNLTTTKVTLPIAPPITLPSTPTSVAATGGEKKPGWNPDAKILEARGVKSLEELNKLPPTDIGD